MAEFQALDRVSGIDYKRNGYLFLLDERGGRRELPDGARRSSRTSACPRSCISPDDVKALIPALETSDLLAAAYCPIDGHASPESVVQAYAGAAAAQGVQILQGTSLDRIAVLGDKIVSVETSAGRIRTDTVDLHGRRLVAGRGQPRRARHPRARRGALDALHAGGRRAARGRCP